MEAVDNPTEIKGRVVEPTGNRPAHFCSTCAYRNSDRALPDWGLGYGLASLASCLGDATVVVGKKT